MKTATWYQIKVNYVFLYESSEEMDNNSPTFGKKKVAQLIGEKNFQSWKQRVLLWIHGYNLDDHLHGKIMILHVLHDADGC